ncbi:MAG TPA: protein kinase [Candidatus Eisenbacteria bacterium]|nr:protein kinase [Candidatus Eisenbacteria bacterium]
MPLTPGSRIAGFEIVAPLGEGGMGEVYRARDPALGRDVAIKVLPAEALEDTEARQRLMREARLASSLNHPNVCTIHQVGEDEGRIFIAMELVEGRPLTDWIGDGLPADQVIRIGIQIADALRHAHDHGVIHRDLKSSNVVLSSDGRAKVLDFGVARRVGPSGGSDTSTLTASGAIVGTPHVLPPEVLRGEPADARGDLWALGVLLFEMATGTLPFRGDSSIAMMASVLHEPHARLPAHVPEDVRAVIDRCLMKDPGDRFQRAQNVRVALEAAAGRSGARRRRARAILVAGVGVVAAILLVANLGTLRRWFGARVDGRITSIAVLPLQNLSGDPAQEYFADGITEDLITSLAALEGVRVISRTSIMRFKRTTDAMPRIARELGVSAIVEGSAMRTGDQVRITAQLIDARHDRQLWARRYDRRMSDVLAVQDEVVQAIASEIRAALRPAAARAARSRAVNPAAYESYLLGRYEWNQRTESSIRKAMILFERSIAADSSLASAHLGLADAYLVLPNYSRVPTREVWPLALQHVTRALELDDHDANAHATLAQLRYRFADDWAGAEAEFRRALELNPNNATARQWFGLYLAHAGRLEEAAEQLALARRLDPFSRIIRANQGQVEYWNRRPDRALTFFQEVLAVDPTFPLGHTLRGWALVEQKRFPEASRAFRTGDSLQGGSFYSDSEVRASVARGDLRAYWLKAAELEEADFRSGSPRAWSLAVCYGQLGDRERAWRWLQRSFDDREAYLLFAIRGPLFDPLRSDPRVQALLRRHGLEP